MAWVGPERALGLADTLISTQGKDDRGEEMTVIVLPYRTNLPYSVETRPWHIWVNGVAKPLE